ncbi:MAG TPA: class I SAM-dependent methyltransferase [Alphaproteobacteria bacterium]|nr:class I SAM-dependent methyltransferase [Alphaproteobacteria bacterium]
MPDDNRTYLGESTPSVLERIPTGAARVLDLGCGCGGNARLLSARGMKVDGVTVSGREAAEASAHCADVYIRNLEEGLPDLPPGRLYDAVICSHVLEHIADPDRMLADIIPRLKRTGVLIVALPNLMLWKSRLKLLAGRFEYTETGLMDRTHVRWYTFASARRLLEAHGFTVIEALADGGLPLGPLRRLMPKGLTAPLDRAACRAAPGLLGYEMIYVARAA